MRLSKSKVQRRLSKKMQQEYTIMVVDDDDDYCFVTKMILQQAGIKQEIITASNGLEAIQILNKLNESGKKLPSLVFLDLKMPMMDGFEFLEEASNAAVLDFNKTRVYINTSSVLPKDKEKVSIYPIAGFIPKPLNQEILKEILNTTQGTTPEFI